MATCISSGYTHIQLGSVAGLRGAWQTTTGFADSAIEPDTPASAGVGVPIVGAGTVGVDGNSHVDWLQCRWEVCLCFCWTVVAEGW